MIRHEKTITILKLFSDVIQSLILIIYFNEYFREGQSTSLIFLWCGGVGIKSKSP